MNGKVHDRNREDTELKQLGGTLRDVRKYLGLKQDEVAAHLSIPRTALSNVEDGHQSLAARELEKLAKLYGQHVSYFIEEDSVAVTLPNDVARQAASLSSKDREELR